ncbi:hypothetical protein RhiirC2_122709 [Rhizophagus irregularis]|uniref:Uncharacterized protein n=1 Tax=Rhizophagus irregularis TaxID=588596 RepID=A0A2N1MQH8_9GLOM|nr:hypothetical protein RhiirC2_122709 [Rhizophagus irregularis]
MLKKKNHMTLIVILHDNYCNIYKSFFKKSVVFWLKSFNINYILINILHLFDYFLFKKNK